MKKLFLSFYFFGIAIIPFCQGSKESELFYQRAMSEMNPKYVKWIKTKAAEADVSDKGINDLQRSAWEDFVEAQKTSGAIDINALVQCVLRASYLQTTEDLRFYAEKVKYFNECKKLVREYLQKLRDYNSNMKGSFSRSQYDSIKTFSLSINTDMTLPSNPNLNRTVIKNDLQKTKAVNQPVNYTIVTKPVNREEVEPLIKELEIKNNLLDQNIRQASLKMPLLTERAQKADSMATNLYKKIADNADKIIANLK